MNDIDLASLKMREDAELRAAVTVWLGAFETALDTSDRSGLTALFEADGHWRDVLAYTWHLTPRTGAEAIADGMLDRQPAVKAFGFEIDPNRTPPRLSLIHI